MITISVYSAPAAIRAFARDNDLAFSEVRRAQVYALYEMFGHKRSEICDITGYAPSTVSTMRYKMEQFAALAEMIFGEAEEEPAEVVEVVVPTPTTTKVRRFRDGLAVPMNYLPGCGEDVEGRRTVYLFKFYGADRSVPIFSKIGTTERSVDGRLRDEIGTYRKSGFDVRSVDVCKMLDCGEIPPEACESQLRADFVKQFPGTYRKNDRFFDVDIPEDIFTKICQGYLS